jgi:hypothetical protein
MDAQGQIHETSMDASCFVVKTGEKAHPASYVMDAVGSFLQAELQKVEFAFNPFPSSTKI